MTHHATALVVGGTGLSGSYTAQRLKSEGWRVLTTGRSPARLGWSDEHIALDLTQHDAALAQLKPLTDVTNVFYCTWSRQADEAANVRVNGQMIRTLFAGLTGAPLRHAALVTGLKHYLGSFDDYARTRPYTPFLESSPRLPGQNFYYTQEDELFAAAKAQGFSWSVHRPHTLIGYVLGNAMNMAVTLAFFASVCRATGQPFIFPGSQVQYNAVTDVTDARQLADQMFWAATTSEAANMPFNVANGDVFRWSWLWAQIAEYFGLEPIGPGETPTPLTAQMREADQVWPGLVAEYGLVQQDLSRTASWWHTDADLGRELECFTDMANSRRLGFTGHFNTRGSFISVFDRLRAERIIPR